MTWENNDLVHALEKSFFLLPEVPGRLEIRRFAGVKARVTALSHAFANIVGQARLTAANADGAIRKVLSLYEERKQSFTWIVTPLSTPNDLSGRLRSLGYATERNGAGLYLSDLRTKIPANSEIRIRVATANDLDLATDVAAHAFPMPKEVARFFNEIDLVCRDLSSARVYLAFLRGREEPVGFGVSLHFPREPITMLSGAATLPGHRGCGVYTSLVARRVADAAALGNKAVVIQADCKTSAPICRKLGFRDLCTTCGFECNPSPPKERRRWPNHAHE